jgi:transcription initiation factor TFIIB
MNDAVKRGVSAGKDPMGLAAAVLSQVSYPMSLCHLPNVLYIIRDTILICILRKDWQKSKVDLVNARQTTDPTIRKRVKELKSRLELNKD